MDDRNWHDEMVNRRAFLGWASKGAAMFALGGMFRTLQPDHPFVRPPGAVSEEEFLPLCTRCHRCAEVCPYRAIRPILLTESIIAAGTPVLQGLCWRGHCSLNCIGSCPSGALR